MSSLQLWLAILGGLALAGVVAHGAWQSRRSELKRARNEGEAPQPAATADERREPTLGVAGMVEPQAADESPAARAQRRSAGPRLDALVDTIATLQPEAAVSGDAAIQHLPPSRRAGTKPVLIEGLNSASGEWEPLRTGTVYRSFQAGVQLANRSGALNEIEYSEYAQKVEAFAEELQAGVEFGDDMLESVARARELDAFASQHDAQLALRLVARGAAWTPGYIQQHAARHGFVTSALPGRLVLPSAEDGAPPVLSLNFDSQAALADDPAQSAVRELTLAFDVPQTPAEERPFDAWCAAGEALCIALDAAMFDDSGTPLSPQSFPAIGAAVTQLYADLAAQELAAGTPAARRLFS
ncbi:cell division protein FtsZ [Rivibacter subsaxonicus]|uniref:ZipA C-terminal FtsZ-binding domain-containing protein n=1 Tax=Rivibacter subsaxonicus TaxID=457575 RepID=A0A4Q7VA44_9BURK|nr:cell division protein FtsZ [Rivibacter subsaxonicus]RZT93621.1 hypothetical protein EV670_3171 [Rivibacter subsaxonicus]